jgi:WD40 repeat protein
MTSPVFAFDVASGQAWQIADDGACSQWAFSFSPDSSRLAFSSAGTTPATSGLRVWDFGTRSATTVPNAIGGDFYWFGATGRYLFYFVGQTIPPSTNYVPLFVYDMDSQSAQFLGDARWVLPSGDGHSVAFERSDGKAAVWSDRTAMVTELDSMGADPTGISPIRLSPDGQTISYIDATANLHAVQLDGLTNRVVAGAVSCQGGSPIGVVWRMFSVDSQAVATLAAVAGQCVQGLAPEALHVLDLASGTDQSHELPAADVYQAGGLLAMGSRALAYDFTLSGTTETHVWSPSTGDVTIPMDRQSNEALYVAVSKDDNRAVFALDVPDPQTVYLWDRSAGTVPLANVTTNPPGPFLAKLDPPSGIALAYDGPTRRFVVARPGSTPAPWVVGDSAPLASSSGRTWIVQGTSGSDSGQFALSFVSGMAGFLEGGKPLAASDTHVYFVAADGLCEIGVP